MAVVIIILATLKTYLKIHRDKKLKEKVLKYGGITGAFLMLIFTLFTF